MEIISYIPLIQQFVTHVNKTEDGNYKIGSTVYEPDDIISIGLFKQGDLVVATVTGENRISIRPATTYTCTLDGVAENDDGYLLISGKYAFLPSKIENLSGYSIPPKFEVGKTYTLYLEGNSSYFAAVEH